MSANQERAMPSVLPVNFFEVLRERLEYLPAVGVFYWKSNARRPDVVGSQAGSVRKDGNGDLRCTIKFMGKGHYRARLAFAWMTGRLPECVDHINGNSSDDRWENLREATRSQNNFNKKPYQKRSSLPVGVKAQGNRFQARIAANGKTYHLGTFLTPEEAGAAVLAARKSLYGSFMRGAA